MSQKDEFIVDILNEERQNWSLGSREKGFVVFKDMKWSSLNSD